MHTLPKHGEIPVLILEVDVQAPSEIGHRVVYPLLVFFIDDSIAVDVFPTDAAQSSAVLSGMVVYLFLTLENSVIDITDLCSHRMADYALHTVAAKCAASSDGLRQFGHLVAVGSDVTCKVILEVTNVSTITHVELNAFVDHLTCVNPLTATFAHHTNAWHVNKNVLSLLVVPFKRTVEGIVEESEVEAEVGLCGGLPLQIVVAQLVALETRWQCLTAVGAGNVVAGAIALTSKTCLAIVAFVEGVASNVGDFLITCLSP